MTTEKLKQAISLTEEIQALEVFLKAFHEPCMKGLIAYRTGIKKPATLGIESELCEIIGNYLEQRLAVLKNKFEEM